MENERMSHEDYLRCDRVWQRVAPELEPYPQLRGGDAEALKCRSNDGTAEQVAAFVAEELADRRQYMAHLRCAPTPVAKRILRQIADEEGSHARRLMGIYYVLTGRCLPLPLNTAAEELLPWCSLLRQRYHHECSGSAAYHAAAEQTEDGCLKAIFLRLAEDEQRHAAQMLQLLEGNLPTHLA